MVKKSLTNKREVLFIISAFIVVASLVYIFAATLAFDSPGGGTNNSGTISLNCTTTLNYTEEASWINITWFYNTTWGPTANHTVGADNSVANAGMFGYVMNGSNSSNTSGILYNTSTIHNITLNTALFNDSTFYNISCYIDNGSDQEFVAATNITFDNTPPRVNFTDTSSTMNISNNGNYSATIGVAIINVSFSDAIWTNYSTSGSSVWINVSNQSGGMAPFDNLSRLRNSTDGASVFFNGTVNVTSYADGKYNFTIVANDSTYLNSSSGFNPNLNNSEYIQITIDSTNPENITIANTTSTTTTQISATISAADGMSGVDNCEVDSSSGWTITGRGTGTQTLVHTGLSCGTKYSYTVTCLDQAGNSNASDSTTLSTLPCTSTGGNSPSGGDDPTVTTWIQTFVITDEQFEQGYTKSIGANRRAKIRVEGEDHYVGIKSVTATSATIEISSNPKTVKLDIGDDAKVDVDDNGYYDVHITLNGIVNGEADLTIKSISEEVPEDVGEGIETSGEIVGDDDGKFFGKTKIPTWVWWIIGIVIILIIASVVLGKKKKRK